MRAPEPPAAAAAPVDDATTAWGRHRPAADRVFRASVAVAAALTAAALWSAFGGGGRILGTNRLGVEAVVRVAVGFTIVSVLWGWLWYGIRSLLLAKLVGLSKDERRMVFRSRMDGTFDLAVPPRPPLRAPDPHRRHDRPPRPVHHDRRDGVRLRLHARPRAADAGVPRRGLQESLLDSVALSWVMIAAYYSSGFLGRVLYGAQMRIMDGTLARANCLLITTLWMVARFLVIPIGGQIAHVFPPALYGAVFAFVWLSYVAGDTASEVVGSLFGRQKLRVWGLGDVNRKSVAGTWACFLGALALCAGIAAAQGLPAAWYALALAVAASNTAFELFSPRGTDDVTMVTANALLCWAFGAFVL